MSGTVRRRFLFPRWQRQVKGESGIAPPLRARHVLTGGVRVVRSGVGSLIDAGWGAMRNQAHEVTNNYNVTGSKTGPSQEGLFFWFFVEPRRRVDVLRDGRTADSTFRSRPRPPDRAADTTCDRRSEREGPVGAEGSPGSAAEPRGDRANGTVVGGDRRGGGPAGPSRAGPTCSVGPAAAVASRDRRFGRIFVWRKGVPARRSDGERQEVTRSVGSDAARRCRARAPAAAAGMGRDPSDPAALSGAAGPIRNLSQNQTPSHSLACSARI
jgi:hypothetical protein